MAGIRYVVERITYQNPDNGCSVLKVRVKGYDDLILLVGNLLDAPEPAIASGSEVLLAAPTGRAAKRMTEAAGLEAKNNQIAGQDETGQPLTTTIAGDPDYVKNTFERLSVVHGPEKAREMTAAVLLEEMYDVLTNILGGCDVVWCFAPAR